MNCFFTLKKKDKKEHLDMHYAVMNLVKTITEKDIEIIIKKKC